MKNKYILLFLFGFFGIHASAQTLAQAKILYEKGQYEQAKPVFKKFVKSQPNNGNYNLWYGVCCLNTGEAEEAIKYLETAVKRRVTSGQLYLAQAYNAIYRFEDAVGTYEDYIAELTKRRRSTAEAEKLFVAALVHQPPSAERRRRSVLHRQFCRSQERFSRSVQNQS